VCMFYPVQEIALVVTALLGLAVGSIWYSPFLFGTKWFRAAGLTLEDIAHETHIYARIVFAAFVGNLAFVYALSQILAALPEGMGAMETTVLLTLIVVPLFVSTLVWEKRTPIYFFIHTGFIVVYLVLSITVLTFWPW
jgi:hypothetical protein